MSAERLWVLLAGGVLLFGTGFLGFFASITLGLAMDVKERGPTLPPMLEADFRQVGYERGVDWALLAAWDGAENSFKLPVRSQESLFAERLDQALEAKRQLAEARCLEHPGDPSYCPPPAPSLDPDERDLLWQAAYRVWHSLIVNHVADHAALIQREQALFDRSREAGYRLVLPGDLALRAAELYEGYRVLDELDQDVDHYQEGAAVGPPPDWHPVAGFAWPAQGPITSRFGWRISPIDGSARQHSGIDIGLALGTPIRASRDGVVIRAGYDPVFGNVVVVEHGGQYQTLYAHHRALAVAEGQRVKQGQVVGYAGSTGQAVGVHLHFENHYQGTPIDPLLLLGR